MGSTPELVPQFLMRIVTFPTFHEQYQMVGRLNKMIVGSWFLSVACKRSTQVNDAAWDAQACKSGLTGKMSISSGDTSIISFHFSEKRFDTAVIISIFFEKMLLSWKIQPSSS